MQLWNNRRQVILDCLPDNLHIDPKILMDDEVAHSAHFYSWKIGITRQYFFGNMTGCFPDNRQVAKDNIDGLVFLQEIFKLQPSGVALNPGDAIQDVADPNLPVLGGTYRLPQDILAQLLADRLWCD